MTTPLERAHFSTLRRAMLARARCHCMVLLAPRCPGSARTSWAFSPASSPLHRGSLPLPQPSFPTPFPSFLLFPHPSSGPRVPAVLTARVTFHHRILQERDLLDLRMKEVSGKLPGAPLRGPPPPTITSLGSLVPTTPSNSLLHKPLLDPASLALTPCIWSPRFVPRPVSTLSYILAYSVVALFLFPSTVSLSILFCPLSVLRSVTALCPLSLFCPHTAPLPAVSTAPSRPAAPRWSPEVLAASVGPGLHLHPQEPPHHPSPAIIHHHLRGPPSPPRCSGFTRRLIS